MKGRARTTENDNERCVAATVMTEWKIKNKQDRRCPFIAKVFLNGKQLCHRHAQLEALGWMVETKKATVIPQLPRPTPYSRVTVVK